MMRTENGKKNITIALMVAMFLAAVEGTVVTTAASTIARDLNGFENISFVFSAYLLISAISTPIYGKLADLYGWKNVIFIGIIIFLIREYPLRILPEYAHAHRVSCYPGVGSRIDFHPDLYHGGRHLHIGRETQNTGQFRDRMGNCRFGGTTDGWRLH